MAADMVLDVIELELEQTVASDDGDVDRGLMDLGWEWYAPAQDTGVIKRIWRHRDNDRVHAQSGTQGAADFYFGVIANFGSDADATTCLHMALDRIQLHLTAAGFGSDIGDSEENHLWTNDTHAVILSTLLQRAHEPHVIPAAIQFAIQPVAALVNDAERTSVSQSA